MAREFEGIKLGQIISIMVIAFIVMVTVIALFGSVYFVPAGSVGVVFNKMGSNQGFDPITKQQGMGFKIPFAQTIYFIPFQTQTIGFYGNTEERGTYGALTPLDKNGIVFNVDITVRYRLDPNQASAFIEQKGTGIAAMESILATAARADSTRGVFGKFAQEDIPTERTNISVDIMKALQSRLDQEGSGKLKPGFITIEAVDIRQVDFNEKIKDRIVEKQIKLQELQQKTYELQIANQTREIEITNADRDKQAAILRADGEAQSIKLVAFAKAEGIEAVKQSYEGMDPMYVYTKFAEAIQPTDKVYFGFDSLGGNQLNFLDMNQIMAAKTATTK